MGIIIYLEVEGTTSINRIVQQLLNSYAWLETYILSHTPLLYPHSAFYIFCTFWSEFSPSKQMKNDELSRIWHRLCRPNSSMPCLVTVFEFSMKFRLKWFDVINCEIGHQTPYRIYRWCNIVFWFSIHLLGCALLSFCRFLGYVCFGKFLILFFMFGYPSEKLRKKILNYWESLLKRKTMYDFTKMGVCMTTAFKNFYIALLLKIVLDKFVTINSFLST